MQRFDLYTHVHKAVRVLLFDAVEIVGRTDFRRAGEIPALAACVRRMIRLTRGHAEHEDREIHPLVHRLAPEVAADLEQGHDRFEGVEREIEKLLVRIENPLTSSDERVSLGRKVHDMIGPLAADHLTHMALEEARVNRLLWAHCGDGEIREIQGRIIAAIPPHEVGEWIELMIGAGCLSERAALLAGMRATVPADVFAGVTAAARASVAESAWSEALQAADALGAALVERA
ncbi:MAG TPA: hypothetical protein VGR31_09230 [Planctomycetota bacterium]|nr:hypothetical protein [Planctomycetota bacterium]